MSVVTIEWTARAAGRYPGERETVELTEFINGVINGGRAMVIEEHSPIVGFFPGETAPISPADMAVSARARMNALKAIARAAAEANVDVSEEATADEPPGAE